jgi:hypothetical protein
MIGVAIMNLLELAAIAPLMAVVVTATFSTCVLGATKASDCRREGRSGLGWLLVSILAGAGVAALVVIGLSVIVR